MNEDVRALKLRRFRKLKHMKKHIKKDSNILLKNSVNSELLDRRDKTGINISKIHDCERNSSPMMLIGNQIYS